MREVTLEREFAPASFDQLLSEGKLMGSKCQRCGTLFLPLRPICVKCYSREMEWVEMKGRGKLTAFTTIRVASTLMIQEGYGRDNPYCTGIVELHERVKISTPILGIDAQHPERIQISAPP